MEGYSSVTPRLRVARNSSNYGISQIVTATDGPSNLPEFSQLVDLNLKEMAPSEVSEQPNTSTVAGPSIPAHTENPAAVLRALLSRLPAESKNTQPSRSPSQQYLSERESDYDMDLTEPANATRSIVQENLKDIFSKARRDPGDTPQKARTRRGSNASMDKLSINAARDDSEGKRRSLSDEWDNTSGPSHRPATRFKHSPQPVTLEFLRERFSESRLSVEGDEHPPSSRHDFSNDAAIISQESNSFQSDIPMATSTPQQSLRISVNSQFQSNLLDQDTEMQHAIDELDSYGESSANRPISPPLIPPILRKRPMSRYGHLAPVASNSLEDTSRTPTANRFESSSWRGRDYDQTSNRDHDSWGNFRRSGYSRQDLMDETPPQGKSRGQSSSYRPSTPSGRRHSSSDGVHNGHNSLPTTTPPSSPPSNQRLQHHEDSSQASFMEYHDYEEVRSSSKNEQNWVSPHLVHATPTPARPLTSPSISPSRATHSRLWPDSSRSVGKLKEESYLQTNPLASAADLSSSSSQPSCMTAGMSRDSSLQAINNTYHNRDLSLRHRLRSLSPLPSSSKIESKAPDISNVSKASNPDISVPNKKQISSSLSDRATPPSAEDASSKYRPSQPLRSIRTSPWSSRSESDEDIAHEKTDVSSHDKKRLMSIAPPDESDFEEEHLLTPPSRPSSHLSNASVAPRGLKQDQTPSSKDILLSPSTPPSRHTPRTTGSKHQSPTPTKGIPDLPTPSSSDESEHVAWNNAETPRPNVNGDSNASWRPTPRPPGGWLQTPMHPRTRSRPNENADEHGTFQKNEIDVDRKSPEPKTPVRAANMSSSKTPRPPGAWQTPALVPQSSSLQNLERNQTPAPSISKESVLDSKTPYVPGGWTTTPAARKSILKVRFNQETEDTLCNEASKSFAKKVSPNDTSSAPSSSLRSTRAPQASGIRILDAYGRQQFSDKPVEEFTPSRNGQRFADSIGREAQESGQADGDEQLDKDEDPPSSRTELLSRIRRGLDNLVDDIDEIDRERDVRLNDRARMEQLNALSMQARKNRERLRDEATKFQPTFQCDTIPSEPFDLKFSPSYGRRYAAMIILQLLLILLMYRFSIHRAKQLTLNNYFDPFHPNLYLYIFNHDSDTSFQFLAQYFGRSSTRTFGDTLLKGGENFWSSFLHLMDDVESYLWKLWTSSLQTTTWVPT